MRQASRTRFWPGMSGPQTCVRCSAALAAMFTMIRLIDDPDCIVGESIMNLIDELQEAFWDLFNALF